jgi:hypothetical protein
MRPVNLLHKILRYQITLQQSRQAQPLKSFNSNVGSRHADRAIGVNSQFQELQILSRKGQ